MEVKMHEDHTEERSSFETDDIRNQNFGQVEPLVEASDNNAEESILDDIFDIDVTDLSNVQACAAYVREIYDNLILMEADFRLPQNFMIRQGEVGIDAEERTLLYDWLSSIHTNFGLANESFFHTCLIMDHYLARKQLRPSRSRIIGIAALLISAKYEQSYVPATTYFVRSMESVEPRYQVPCSCEANIVQGKQGVYCKACTTAALLAAEKEILATLNYRLAMPTAIAFLRRYAKISNLVTRDRYISFYIAELCLISSHMTKYKQSEIAAGCIAMTRRLIRKSGWDETMSKYSSYSEEDVRRIIGDVSTTLKECALSKKCRYVTRKYQEQRYYRVADLIADVVRQALTVRNSAHAHTNNNNNNNNDKNTEEQTEEVPKRNDDKK